MKPGIIVILLLFGGLIALLVGLDLSAAPARAESQAQQSLATATLYAEPSATPSPTMILPPTENAAATAAVLNVTAAADNARAAFAQATTQIEVANINATAIAVQSESNERVAQAAIVLQETVNKGKEIDFANQVIAKERDRIHNERLGLSIRDKNTGANYLTGFGMVAISVALVVVAVVRRPAIKQDVKTAPRDARPVVQVNDADGLGALQLADDDADFLGPFAARLALVMDGPMSFRGVQAVIKRADWERIRWTLLDLSLAEENVDHSISMNQTGIDTIKKLLPHYASLSRDSVKSADTTQHSTAQHRVSKPEGGMAS